MFVLCRSPRQRMLVFLQSCRQFSHKEAQKAPRINLIFVHFCFFVAVMFRDRRHLETYGNQPLSPEENKQVGPNR